MYCIFGFVTFINLGVNAMRRIISRPYTAAINYDLDTEELLLPMFGFKNNVTRIKPENIVAKPNKRRKDCLYMDKTTGRSISTVGTGFWMNEGIFLHLI